jgi:hypothetical protein
MQITVLLTSNPNERQLATRTDIAGIIRRKELCGLDAWRQRRIQETYPKIIVGHAWDKRLRDKRTDNDLSRKRLERDP